MNDDARRRFDAQVLPHFDAAYNLARWLVRDARDAEDVVQDAMLRALRHVGDLRGTDARPWLLAIVRNASWAWLRQWRPADTTELTDEMLETALSGHGPDLNPETLEMRRRERKTLDSAIAALPLAFREVLILRELEDLAYREIAQVLEVPMGTVMSRLARARALLAASLTPEMTG